MTEIVTHPIQNQHRPHGRNRVPAVVSLRAYEVYSELYRPQPGLITGECRGGFGVAELLAFLYARSFPKNEWRKRFDEALNGMEIS